MLTPPDPSKANIPGVAMLSKNGGQTPAYDVVSWAQIAVIQVAQENTALVVHRYHGSSRSHSAGDALSAKPCGSIGRSRRTKFLTWPRVCGQFICTAELNIGTFSRRLATPTFVFVTLACSRLYRTPFFSFPKAEMMPTKWRR